MVTINMYVGRFHICINPSILTLMKGPYDAIPTWQRVPFHVADLNMTPTGEPTIFELDF